MGFPREIFVENFVDIALISFSALNLVKSFLVNAKIHLKPKIKKRMSTNDPITHYSFATHSEITRQDKLHHSRSIKFFKNRK